MTKTRTFAVALSLCAAVACSEQGPMPTTPAAPSSLEGANAKPGGPPPSDVTVTSTIGAGDIAGVGGAYTNSHTSSAEQRRMVPGFAQLAEYADGLSELHGNGITGTGPRRVGLPSIRDRGPTRCSCTARATLTTPTRPPVGHGCSNTSATCPMAVWFEAGGKKYLLRMNSNQDVGTNDVIITRLVLDDMADSAQRGWRATAPAFILKGKATRASCHKGTTTCRFRSTSRIRKGRTEDQETGFLRSQETRFPFSTPCTRSTTRRCACRTRGSSGPPSRAAHR